MSRGIAWTALQDSRIAKLRAAGCSVAEIAEVTGRTVLSVKQRIYQLHKQNKMQDKQP